MGLDAKGRSTAARLSLLSDKPAFRQLPVADRLEVFQANAADPDWPTDRFPNGSARPIEQAALLGILAELKRHTELLTTLVTNTTKPA